METNWHENYHENIVHSPQLPFLSFNPNMILKAFPKTSHPNKLAQQKKKLSQEQWKEKS